MAGLHEKPIKTLPKASTMVGRFFGASGLVLWSLIASLLFGELALRTAELLGISQLVLPSPTWSTDVPRVWTPDLGLLFKPGAEFRYWMRDPAQTIYDNVQKANGWGFLDREPPGKADSDVRVLILGDSFVEALQVGMEDKIGRVLERLLSEQLQRHVTVMSLAIAGSGQATQYPWWRHFGSIFKPHIVVLVVATNDVRDNYAALVARSYNANPLWRANHYFEMGPGKDDLISIPPSDWYTSLAPDVYLVHPAVTALEGLAWIRQYSKLAHFLSAKLIEGPTGGLDPRVTYRDHYIDHVFFDRALLGTDSVVRTGYELSRRILLRYASDVKMAGANLILMSSWPFPRGSIKSPDFDVLGEWLEVQAATLGVTHISMPDAMLKSGIKADDLILNWNDTHWNSRGHRLAAELLAVAISAPHLNLVHSEP